MVNSISNNTSVGQTGDLGSEYDVQWSRFKTRSRVLGTTDFKSNLFLNGVDGDRVLQNIENHIEGDDFDGNGQKEDLLSWDRYLQSDDNRNDILFQSKDNKLFTDVNFNIDKYEVMDERSFTEKLGLDWSGGKPYDTFSIDQNKINFYEFVFDGIGDGTQANEVFDLSKFTNSRWGIQSYTLREVDTKYWDSKTDPTNQESLLSKDSLEVIMRTMPQWMTDDIKSQLSKLDPNSTEYWTKFCELAVELMDQKASGEAPMTITGPGYDR